MTRFLVPRQVQAAYRLLTEEAAACSGGGAEGQMNTRHRYRLVLTAMGEGVPVVKPMGQVGGDDEDDAEALAGGAVAAPGSDAALAQLKAEVAAPRPPLLLLCCASLAAAAAASPCVYAPQHDHHPRPWWRLGRWSRCCLNTPAACPSPTCPSATARSSRRECTAYYYLLRTLPCSVPCHDCPIITAIW